LSSFWISSPSPGETAISFLTIFFPSLDILCK
jgi:hypothetical protein